MHSDGTKFDPNGMTDRESFLEWVRSTLYEAELALHNGDASPRRAIWSRNDPVSILGAMRNAYGQQELDELFAPGAEFLRLHIAHL